MSENIETYYKELHQIPELGFEEFKTHKYVVDKLDGLNCIIYELKPTGVLAFFDYGFNESIAFRAELDALPIKEENEFEYISKHNGFMHACGHDGHMAMLLKMAEKLNTITCKKNICLIFQPSEENYGGALKVINSNEYESLNIKEVYGIHLWPNLKEGVIASKGRVLMASSTEIDITITGKGAHIANKEEGIDSIKIAYQLLDSIDEEGVLFNCGKIYTTGARNVVCSKIELECSLRSFFKLKRKIFLRKLNTNVSLLANNSKANISVNATRYIPELNNNVMLFEKYRHLIDEVISPVYQSEDFSFYSEKAKILFLFLGIGNREGLHTSKFNFNPKVLEKGLDVLIKIATS